MQLYAVASSLRVLADRCQDGSEKLLNTPENNDTVTPFGNTCFSAAMPQFSWSELLVPFWSPTVFSVERLDTKGQSGKSI